LIAFNLGLGFIYTNCRLGLVVLILNFVQEILDCGSNYKLIQIFIVQEILDCGSNYKLIQVFMMKLNFRARKNRRCKS
jgi:hypothetical protein